MTADAHEDPYHGMGPADEGPDTYMPCPDPACSHRQWVSPEDPDASFGDLWSHVTSRHSGSDRAKTERLMSTVRLVDEDGKTVKNGRIPR